MNRNWKTSNIQWRNTGLAGGVLAFEGHVGWQARRARRPNLGLAIAPHHRGLVDNVGDMPIVGTSTKRGAVLALFSHNLEC